MLHIILVIRRVSTSSGSGVTDFTDSAASGGEAALAAPAPWLPRPYAVRGYIPYLKFERGHKLQFPIPVLNRSSLDVLDEFF
jgi:hypothetical protein